MPGQLLLPLLSGTAARVAAPTAARAIVPAMASRGIATTGVGTNLLSRMATSRVTSAAGGAALGGALATRTGALSRVAQVGTLLSGAALLPKLLGNLGKMFGGGTPTDGMRGGGGTFLTPQNDPTALQAALPTMRSPSMPGLPTYTSGNNDCCGAECCETTNRLLSIAIKYLSNIDTTSKNQLDVQRAEFVQQRQAARETSLEQKSTSEGRNIAGDIKAQIQDAGSGLLSFFGKALLSTIALTMPKIVSTISDFISGAEEALAPLNPMEAPWGSREWNLQNKLQNAPMTGMSPISTLLDMAKMKLFPSAAPTADASIKNVLRREGGYVNDPADRGGETKFGISKKSYPNLDIKNLTETEASNIYKRDYWDKINADQLPANIREMAFDAAVNQGVNWTKSALQQSGNDPQKFLQLRRERYREIAQKDPSQGKFLTGWMNRLSEFSMSPVGGFTSTPTMGGAPSKIETAAIVNSMNGFVGAKPTPPSVVVAQNAPPPSGTNVYSGGPSQTSNPYYPNTIMDMVKYFSPFA
jgi:hypothetical protein